MTVSFWLDDERESLNTRQREKVDLVILGGGIVGAGLAYLLSSRDGMKVALVESKTLGSGSTGRSAGFILRGIQGYYNTAVKRYGRQNAQFIYRFAEENQAMVKRFADECGNSFAYEPCGSYFLASSLEELEDLSESAQLMHEDGFEVEFIKTDPLERDFYGALFNKQDAAIHPANFVRALACASNALIYEGESARRVESDGGKVEVVTSKRIFDCQRLFIATNSYTPFIESSFLDKLQPCRGQALVTQPLRKRILNQVCYANYGWEYFRQLSDNRLLVGGCRQRFLNEERGYAEMITRPVQAAIENYIKDRFPEAAGLPIDYRWSGLMSLTQDGLPLVGELQHAPGVFFAVGCNGHGLSWGLNMCRHLIEVALDGKKPGIFDGDRPSLTEKKAPSAGAERGP